MKNISYFNLAVHAYDGVRRVSGLLLTRVLESTFQWNEKLCIKSSSTETVGSLRNPVTLRTPSYVKTHINKPLKVIKEYCWNDLCV